MELRSPAKSLLEQLRNELAVRELPDRVLLLRGQDRSEWLAGMVTNDTKKLAPGESRYTAIVHEKGKLLADAWVYTRSDSYLLAVPPNTASALLEHFDRHIIMEDVEVSEQPSLVVLSLQGPRAQSIASKLPSSYRTKRLGTDGIDVIVSRDELAATVLPMLETEQAVVLGEEAWRILRFENGIPAFNEDFGTDNYVQEANITDRAVSFQKGCYVGQEVVCRLEMRGHVRRQLALLELDGSAPPSGLPVGEVGQITSSTEIPGKNRSFAFAMLKWDIAREAKSVQIDGREARIVRSSAP